MTNPIQRAFDSSRIAHKSLGGVDVTISDGVSTSGVVTATLGFSGDYVFDGASNTSHYTKSRAFLIDVSDYDVGAGPISPVRGHIITQTVNGVVSTFEVVDFSGDGPDNYDDTNRTIWRCNTKEI